ncbi:MAG: ABC transporter substrate-binding protein [Rectinemataceae bacterium]
MRRLFLTVLAFILVFAPAIAPAVSAQSTSVQILSTQTRTAGFSIDYGQGYKVLSVPTPWPGATRGYRYVLYPRGSSRPAGVKGDRFIQTPVRTVVTFSTSYLPAIEAIGGIDSIVGVDSAAFVYSPAVRERIGSGKTVETTKNWEPDIERMIALKPDLVLSYGMGNEWDTHPKMEAAGLPVVIMAEWNEADPLARAEWAVFIAAFYDKEAEARASFDRLAADYGKIKALAATARDRPSVLVNGPFQGVWSVSGGGSFMARLLADAGAAYLWASDTSTGGLNLSVEAVFSKAANAKYWLNPSLQAARISDVVAMDPRFAALAAVKSGQIWNNNARLSPGGGSDYFESAVMRPDLVLADMAAIFHPELFPGHRFVYYRKVTE